MIILFGLLVFCTLIPFIVLAFFNHPSADDFCYAISFRDPDFKYFFSVVFDWYRRWNARYFSVTLIGVFSRYLDLIEAYKSVPLLLFLGWLVSGSIFLKSIFRSMRFTVVVAGGLTFCIFYIVSMPDVSAGLYRPRTQLEAALDHSLYSGSSPMGTPRTDACPAAERHACLRHAVRRRWL